MSFIHLHFPLSHPVRRWVRKAIWCSSDRAKAWNEWMVDSKAPQRSGLRQFRGDRANQNSAKLNGFPAPLRCSFGDGAGLAQCPSPASNRNSLGYAPLRTSRIGGRWKRSLPAGPFQSALKRAGSVGQGDALCPAVGALSLAARREPGHTGALAPAKQGLRILPDDPSGRVAVQVQGAIRFDAP